MLLLAGPVTACTSGAPGAARAQGKLAVVTATNVWADVAAQVGGDLVSVTSIIGAEGADPHEYDADVRDVASVHAAQLVIVNGLGYDGFLSRLVAADPSGRDVVDAASVVHAPREANPHLWYRPAYVDDVASAIADALTRRLPDERAEIAANLAALRADMAEVSGEIATIRARYAGIAVAYTEPVPQYLVEDAGLRLGVPAGFARALGQELEPSPSDSRAFEDALRTRSVKVLLYNSQVGDPQTRRLRDLAERSRVPVVSVRETAPDGVGLARWQSEQARALLEALGG